jgi:asparagine synthase (glutamine-hydrolysing)
MRPRYLLLAADGVGDWPMQLDRIAMQTGLDIVHSHGRLAAFLNRECRFLTLGEQGFVAGTLFHRHGPAEQVTSLDHGEVERIVESRGERLLSHFWGGFVAAVTTDHCISVLREPSAALPCFFARGSGCTAFTSDAGLLFEAGFSDVEIDWNELARHLYSAGVPTAETCLSGVGELLAGFSMRVGDQAPRQLACWSPWNHVPQESRPVPSSEALARTVKHCVCALASGHKPLLSVSGGLDSSIVAAALAKARCDTICLTMYTDDAGGDERSYARALCAHLGLRLLEMPYRLEQIDIAEPLGAHLPRPGDRTQALAYERAHLEAAHDVGASAFVTGNGGDSIFGYSQSGAAIADRFLAEGLVQSLETLVDVCRQTGCSLFDAATAAWRGARGPKGYVCRPNALFLHPDIVTELAGTRLDHEWLDAPADALPGKAAHIASILRVQQALEPSRSTHLPVLNPLMSQPILEACLGVPSWEWRSGGRDRALARRAFAADLPPVILNRRLKGSPSHFAGQILNRFRGAIRERLLDGHLARERIIDADALMQALSNGRPCADQERVRILEFVAAEAWIDSWLARSKPARTAPLRINGPVVNAP